MKNKTSIRLTAFLTCSAAVSLLITGCGSNNSENEPAVQITETSSVLNESIEEPVLTEETVTEAEEEYDLSKADTFELTSESITDGVWNSVITNTAKGSNVSPQLSWEPVESAGGYAVYMIDTSAKNWLHWKSTGITETHLAEGWADSKEYIGPYPPDGTHTYDVYVFALKNAPAEIPGTFDSSNDNFMSNWQMITAGLDNPDGTSGNIISYGYISGTYTKGE